MSWQLVARKDFADAVRSQMLWGIIVVGGGLALAIAVLYGAEGSVGGGVSPTIKFIGMFGPFGGVLLFPTIALVTSYMAIVGERQSGSIHVLFGLPHSRADILAGKLIGRTTIVALSIVAVCAAAGGALFGLYGSLSVGNYVVFSALTVLVGVVFASIAVAISAVASTRGRAMAGAIGSYFLFTVVWEPLVAGVHYVVEGQFPGLDAPLWYFFLKRLSPTFAYIEAVNGLLDLTSPRVRPLFPWPVENIPADQLVEFEKGTITLAERVGGDIPFYLEAWFAPVILGLWVVVAAVVGYWRFRRTDFV